MQSALIAHSGPPSVAASSVHGGDSAAVATAAAASEVAAESADLFCLLADPGPDDDPPCEGEGKVHFLAVSQFTN